MHGSEDVNHLEAFGEVRPESSFSALDAVVVVGAGGVSRACAGPVEGVVGGEVEVA